MLGIRYRCDCGGRPGPNAPTGGPLDLIRASKSLSGTLDVQEVLQRAVDGVATLSGLGTCAVYLIEGDNLALRAASPPLPPDFPDALRIARLDDHPHIRTAVTSGEALHVWDIRTESLTPEEQVAVDQRDLRTVLYMPLAAEGETLGIFIAASTGEPSEVSDNDIERVQTLAELSALALVNARLYATAQRRARELEESLAQGVRAQLAQRLSEGRYRALFEHSPAGIVIVDDAARCVDANPGICQLLGYSRDEVIGTPVSDLVVEEESARVRPALRSIDEGSSHTGEWTFRRRDSTVLEAEVTARKLPDGNVMALIRDMTPQREAEEERLRLQGQLQHAQKMESVGRLAGGIAHDFNNMLSVILGHTEFASDKTEAGDPVAEDLAEIRDAAERSASLTRKLLAFARRQTANPVVLDLNEVIPEMTKILRRLIGEDIDLVWRPGPEPALVRIDPAQMDQILANLCVNARDAIAGVGTVSIETGARAFGELECADQPGMEPGDYVVVAVSDDGSGMDEETLANVFEPFFTTKIEGKGTGLGLATVYGIVKQNDGFIAAHSEPGLGTTMKVYLPRAASDPLARSTSGSREPLVGGDETVLIVEDERGILKIGKKLLRSLGYRVLTADTPSRALDIAERHTGAIDLLLTDVVLPEMNGSELADRLQARDPGLQVLFMSAYTGDVIASQGLLNQGVQLLEKPFSREELAARVREALKARGPES